ERAYGDRPVESFALGAARGLTLGGSDVALRAPGVETEALREIGARSRIAGTTGEITGPLARTLATGSGLAQTPAGLAGGLGRALAARGAERGALRRAGAVAAGAGAEGALVGAGQGVSELALSDDPVTAERAASVLSSRALYGG